MKETSQAFFHKMDCPRIIVSFVLPREKRGYILFCPSESQMS
uniref:Uncharacterized protein n=1 Tax=Arundo donax TaxID=35708 RepID=A0A0A9GJY3_ARUDO